MAAAGERFCDDEEDQGNVRSARSFESRQIVRPHLMSSAFVSEFDKPQQSDLDRCVHCGLCLNACPTYRELHVEMDSPRGRIYQMVQVSGGAAISPSYIEHIELCLACRGCETACPSGVQYGRLVEAARAEIESKIRRPWRERMLRWLVFRKLLPSRLSLEIAGALLYLYQASGLKRLVGMPGFLPARLRELEESGAGNRDAVLLRLLRQDAAGRGRAAPSRGVPGRMHREHQFRALERGHGAGAAEKRM